MFSFYNRYVKKAFELRYQKPICIKNHTKIHISDYKSSQKFMLFVKQNFMTIGQKMKKTLQKGRLRLFFQCCRKKNQINLEINYKKLKIGLE